MKSMFEKGVTVTLYKIIQSRWFNMAAKRKYSLGDRVKKVSGAEWEGIVCGFYVSSLTEIGYAVESETHKGSVQIYPETALVLVEGVNK